MSFEKIKNRFGFGIMRLKMVDDKVDYDEFTKMVDAYMKAGFNYFDTAHGYIDGKSEIALRDCLTSRYDREDYFLANKISSWMFGEEKDVIPYFNEQLEICGVDYFDSYLFHCINHDTYPKYKDCNVFETMKDLKEQGKIKHLGISFHDTADYLDMVLTEQPYLEFVQLQINYLDYDDPTVQSQKCYDVAVKHGKKVVIMEPVKGGHLVNLPKEAAKLFDEHGKGSYASYALRFAASYPEVIMVLSGMGTVEMMEDNIKTFTNFVPFSEEEYKLTDKAREIIRQSRQIPCTKCNYCADVCKANIPISENFEVYNSYTGAKISKKEAKANLPTHSGAVTDCIKCGKCENVCPQHIAIREQLERIAKIFGLNKK